MIKGIVICGGIWAATATSVALVRYPQHTDEEPLGEGEIETLDPEDFTSEEGKEQFASKYPSYFASTKESNKKFWEDRFEERKIEGNAIVLSQASSTSISIVSGWDEPQKTQTRVYSLVSFCRQGYNAKSEFDKDYAWDFHRSEDIYRKIGDLKFWWLCSVVNSKPENIYHHHSKFDDSDHEYLENTIGRELEKRLVQADRPHTFWDIREQEWQLINVTDSLYFGNEKKPDNSIKNLCLSAYKKNVSISDTADTPNSTTVIKYCGLEWDWN